LNSIYHKVEIDGLDWSLTDETGRQLASNARKLALRDAWFNFVKSRKTALKDILA
jgi:hypothetical protein